MERDSVMEVTVEVVDDEEGAALFDARTRTVLGITGAEFLDRYDSGEAWDLYGHDAVTSLSMLIPFARGVAQR